MNQLAAYVGKRILNKLQKSVSRDKSVQNFSTAKRAVILFDTSLPNCFQPVKEFSKFLKKEGIKTDVFGLVMQKETPQEMLLWANFSFINRKDINWYGRPGGEVVDSYFSRHPDLLVVINMEQQLPMEYLIRLSDAKFKIGCFTEEENDLDLMINPTGESCESNYFIEQIKHYVQLLNPEPITDEA
jgi:hypothetical protein